MEERGAFLPAGAGEAMRRAVVPVDLRVVKAIWPVTRTPLNPFAIVQWSVDALAGWRVTGTADSTPTGAIVLGSLSIVPADPGAPLTAGLTTKVIRAIQPGLILDDVSRWVAHQHGAVFAAREAFRTPWQPTQEQRDVFAEATETGRHRAGGRPRFLGEDHFRGVALTALRLQQERGTTRGLREVLADHYRVAPATVRDWLRVAREHGFLAKTVQGRPGVVPGPRLTEENR